MFREKTHRIDLWPLLDLTRLSLSWPWLRVATTVRYKGSSFSQLLLHTHRQIPERHIITMAATILNLLSLYPETNPFSMLPTLYNLTPDPDFLGKNDVNGQELATADAAEQIPDSPLFDINGPNH